MEKKMCANLNASEHDMKEICSGSVVGQQQNKGHASNAHATGTGSSAGNRKGIEEPNGSEEMVIKKRKTRRGKSKRRFSNPYTKMSWQQRKNLNNRKYRSNVVRVRKAVAVAPFNSNQFLMEDHGELQELDDKLNKTEVNSVVPVRTRDSSFSVDSDADFYSSPEDEEEFLTKEFDHTYEDLHAERLQSMSKAQLIEEYLQMENRIEMLTKRLRSKSSNLIAEDSNAVEEEGGAASTSTSDNTLRQEINKLLLENDELRRENEHLRNNGACSSSSFTSSVDSESDSSSSSCSNSSSTKSNESEKAKTQSPPPPSSLNGFASANSTGA